MSAQVPFPLPPGMVDEEELENVGDVPQAPMRRPPARQHTALPSIVFPSGNKVPLQDLTTNDVRLPMIGDRIASVLQGDVDQGDFVIPAGCVVYRKIAAVGIARIVRPQPQQMFWVFLVEVPRNLLQPELLWVTSSAQGTVDGKILWEALPA